MESKKTKIISIVAIVVLSLTVITATYAYFQAQTGEGSQTDIKINANTVDTFTFETGSAMSLSLDQTSFASGKGNITGSTFASAKLTANNKTNTATEHYYLYLSISDNTFTYSINESTPEIIMTVTDSSGNEVTNISTLNHVIVTGANGTQVSGYDITNKSGLITLFNNREIVATPTKEEKWNIKVTFVNYDASQNANAGKSMSAKVMIQKEKLVQTMANVCKNGQTLSSCVIAMDGIDETLYHHTSKLTNGAGDNSYRYAGGDYVLTEAGKSTGATMMIGYNNTVTTTLIDFYCNGKKQYVGATCGASLTHYYLIKGDTTQYQTYKETLNKAVEKGYLTKDNVKNFVCFGSTVSPCPTENLYRIIGVFGNNVKLIKWDYAKSSLLGTDGDFSKEYSSYFSGERGENQTSNSLYYWNKSTQKNTWSESNLNKINLNTNFVNNIGTEWANKIAITTWKVGGNTSTKIGASVPATAYQNEVVHPVVKNTTDSKTEYKAKVGLMYVSDYGFAAAQSAWTLVGYNSSDATKDYRFSKGENWLYGGGGDWTISRYADNSINAFRVGRDDGVGIYYVDDGGGVRPSFNLLSSITYAGGSGTQSDPIIIE